MNLEKASITAQERDTYQLMWEFPTYAEKSRGETYAELAVEVMGTGTVLDAGTGGGKGALALIGNGCQVFGCDLTLEGRIPAAREAYQAVEACLWHDLAPVAYLAYANRGGTREYDEARRARDCGELSPSEMAFDWVYCCDVLEHLPKEFVLLAVVRMLAVSRRGVFLSVALGQESWGMLVGRVLHQTVEDFLWWRDRLRELGVVTEARDLGDRAIFVVRPETER